MSLLDQIEGLQVKALRPSGGCHSCPRKLVNFVPATLVAGKVIFVGEAPGASDVVDGALFSGEGGKVLRREAYAAGVPAPWSLTSAIHCQPPEGSEPHPKEIQCCLSQYVLDEIRDYPFVVLLGSVPLQALFPGGKGSYFRGNFALHPDFPGQRFFATYSPGYVIKRPDLLGRFQTHMQRLARVARGEPEQQIEIIRGPGAVDAMRDMARSAVLSYDTETTGVELWDPLVSIETLGLSNDGKRVAVVHESDPWFTSALGVVQSFMEDQSKGVIGSHVAYDVEITEMEGDFRARLQGIHDVSVIWYEAAQYQQASLKQLASEQLDGYRNLLYHPHAWKDVDVVLRYMAEDIAYAFRLFVKGMQMLRPATRDLVVRALGPMSLVYQRAHTKGLYIRQGYRQQKIVEYEERRREAVLSWKAEDPEFVPEVNESGDGLDRYLFEVRKLPVLAVTKQHKPVVDKETLKQYVRDGATYLRHLLRIREIDKLLGTYLRAYDKHVDLFSRIHPNHWLTSTDTSRPASTDPNVYNVARNREVRDMFGVAPGACLIESDLSQIEFRIMVCLAKDEAGIAGYLRGDDAHTMTARTITGNENPTKGERTLAKPVNFGNLYGAHWKMAQAYALNEYGVEWTDQQAQDFQNAFFGTYKRLPEFHRASRAKLRANRGWFESATGHVFHYADWDHPDRDTREHWERSALNSEAQGPAANICFYIAVLARRLLDARGFANVLCVNSVYDSIMTECPDPRDAAAVIETIDAATQQAYEWVRPWFGVPLVIEHKVGESWGSLEDWKP